MNENVLENNISLGGICVILQCSRQTLSRLMEGKFVVVVMKFCVDILGVSIKSMTCGRMLKQFLARLDFNQHRFLTRTSATNKNVSFSLRSFHRRSSIFV